MSLPAITEEEFLAWKRLPPTQALIAILQAKRENLRQRWESGAFTDYETEATVLVNVGNLGTCKGYAFVTDFTYDDYLTEIDDGTAGEQQRPSAGGSSSAN